MNVRVVAADALGDAELARWSQIQEADPALASPFLRPEFAAIVSAGRRDVHVGVLERDGEAAGFFAFQRGRLGIGRPVGFGVADHQGVVAAPGLSWTAEGLLRGCGLRTLEFDHLVAGQRQFEPFVQRLCASPIMDLSAGFDAYMAGRRAAGARDPRTAERRRRKLEREHGPVRFEAHSGDPGPLATLLRWKADQYERTGAGNVLAAPWVRATLAAAHTLARPGFAGMLSTLSVEDRLIAVHFGLRSQTVWHWWFPAYDPEFGGYSPGLLLLLEMARSAPGLGLHAIDLGKGEARYKTSMMTSALGVAEGAIELPSVAAAVGRLRRRARTLARRSGLGAPLRTAARRVARVAQGQRRR